MADVEYNYFGVKKKIAKDDSYFGTDKQRKSSDSSSDNVTVDDNPSWYKALTDKEDILLI